MNKLLALLILIVPLVNLPAKPVGILHGLETLIEIQRKKFITLTEKVSTNPKLINDLDHLKNIYLDPYFLSSILFYSPKKYLNLYQGDECRFFSLIKNNLLKTAEGEIKSIVVVLEDTSGKKEQAILTKSDFFEFFYKKKCFDYKEYDSLYSQEKLKDTLTNMPFTTPKGELQCKKIYQEWKKNTSTPYLCGIYELFRSAREAQKQLIDSPSINIGVKRNLRGTITKATEYKNSFSKIQYSYLENLCEGLNQEENFCESFLSESVWEKAITGEKPVHILKYRCQEILNRPIKDEQDLKKCAKILIADPDSCHLLGNKLYPSLIPKPNCKILSMAFKESNLSSKYQDCPARVDNEGMTNLFRLFSHLNNKSFDSDPKNCAAETSSIFAQFNFDADNDHAWGIKLCYDDPILQKEVCLPTILGEIESSKYSEDKIISQIMAKTKSTPEKLKCHILNKKFYNSATLAHKTGCQALYDENHCTATNCPKTVIYSEKKFNHIRYRGDVIFDYFPNSFQLENYSIHNVLKKHYKFNSKIIRNLTNLKYFLKTSKNVLIHGIGCQEDLLPSFFRKSVINQCSPLHFVVDKSISINSRPFIIIRLAIDDIHTPRIIPWTYLFSSVKSYQAISPLNQWSLYAIW